MRCRLIAVGMILALGIAGDAAGQTGRPLIADGAAGASASPTPASPQTSDAYLFPGSRPPGAHEWRIVAVGDIMAPTALIHTARAHRDEPDAAARGYLWPFRQVGSRLADADLAIGNLEFPVLPDAPPQGKKPYNGEPAYLDALKAVGFDVLFTANNHVYDQGIAGTEATIAELSKRGLRHLGTDHVGQPRSELLLIEAGSRKKLKVAFLNYTSGISDLGVERNLEHILFGRNINLALFKSNERLAKEAFRHAAGFLFPSALIAYVDDFIENVRGNIEQARSQGADYVIVFLHWGDFKQLRPSEDQARLARRLCLAGADAIIGAGPHVIQPIELIDLSRQRTSTPPERLHDECMVAYSLGNFIGHMSPITRTGMILELNIAQNERGTYLRSYVPHIVRTEVLANGNPGAGDAEEVPEIELRHGSLDQFLAELP